MNRFDEVAQSWDENPSRLAMAKAISEAMQQVVDFNDKDLLELGCGTGLVGISLAVHAKSLLGIDSSQNMVKVFNQKVKDLGLKNARAQNKDLFTDDFQVVDIVFSSMVMHHIEDTEAALRRAYSLLRPGGSLLIADLVEEDGTFHSQGNEGIYHFGFNKDQLIRNLKKYRFTDIHYSIAYVVERENGKKYPIFLISACKEKV